MEENPQPPVKIYKMAKKALYLYLIFDLILFFGLIWVPFVSFLVIILAAFELTVYYYSALIISSTGVTVKQGWLIKHSVDVPFEQINSVSVEKGIIGNMFGFGDILIMTGNDVVVQKFHYVLDPDSIKNEIMQHVKPNPTTATPQPAPSAKDPYAQITELATLKDKGVITQEEFEAKKKQLLEI